MIEKRAPFLLEILFTITNTNEKGPKWMNLRSLSVFVLLTTFATDFKKCAPKTVLNIPNRKFVQIVLKHLFPNLVGYSRFVQLTSEAFFPMFCFIKEHQGLCDGILFIDSTVLTVCHVKRASSHRTFKEQAHWGKTTTGLFFEFKLHLVINHHSEIVAFRLTSGNIDDRKPVLEMIKGMKGKAFADRGYISEKLTQTLMKNDIHLFTKVKKNMKNKLLSLMDKLMLKKRAIIEVLIIF